MPKRGTSRRRTGKTQRKDHLYKTIFSSAEDDIPNAETRFLRACQHGDEQEAMACAIQEQVNVNCVDFLGRNALELAADGDHEEIILFLLPRCNAQCVQDALLHSVSLGRVNICEILLQHSVFKSNKFNFVGGEFYNKRSSDNPRFSSDVTPIMLAAQLNNYRMVQMLLLHGARISKPHDYNCHCVECKNMRIYDSVKYSRTRLNAYRGLAGTAYLSLANEDPLLAAFRLSHELDYLETVEKEYQTEYSQLNEKCKNYAVQLLNQCRTSEEVITTLSGPQKKSRNNIVLNNLTLALKYDQKRFIAHAVVQRQLSLLWYDNALFLRNRGGWFILMMIPLAVLAFPLMILAYVLVPVSKVVKLVESPIVKFVNHSISYFTFLVLIFVASVRYGQIWVQIACAEKNTDPTTYNYFVVQLLIFCWAVGMFAYEAKQLFWQGIRGYLKDWWNFVDMFTISSYLSSLALSVITYYEVVNAGNKHELCTGYSNNYPSDSYCDLKTMCEVEAYENNNFNCQSPSILTSTEYFSKKWKNKLAMPPSQQLADIIFAVANTISFMRITYLLPASNQLGPLMISYGRMMKDGVKFLMVFVLVFLTFICGLSSLYKIDPCSNHFFTRIDLTVRSLFWATFGMGDSNAPVIDARSRYYNLKESSINEDVGLMLTEIFGYLLFAAYIIAAVIVLMNMLIAMMSNTFQEIYDDSDVEWKFARTELWMTYVNEENTLPAPFNLIPRPYAIFIFFKDMCKKREVDEDDDNGGFIIQNPTLRTRETLTSVDRTDIQSSRNGIGMNRINSQRLDPYRRTIKRLVKRYVFQKLYKTDKKQKKMDNENGRFDNDDEELLLGLSTDIAYLREDVTALAENLGSVLTKRNTRGRLPGSFRRQISDQLNGQSSKSSRRGSDAVPTPNSPDSLNSFISLNILSDCDNDTSPQPTIRKHSSDLNIPHLSPVLEDHHPVSPVKIERDPEDDPFPEVSSSGLIKKRNSRRGSILDELQSLNRNATNISMATTFAKTDMDRFVAFARRNSENMVSEL